MATSVLLVHQSGEGQTTKIAERIANRMRDAGMSVTSATAEGDPDPAGSDVVVAGDSIHMGRHSRELIRWLGDHAEQLEAPRTALFQVSLTSAHGDPDHEAEAQGMVRDLLDATGFDPDLVGMFAGAIAYTRYGWVKRRLMRRIAADAGDPTDTSRDHEFTDWDAVDHFTDDVMATATA